MPLPVQEIRLCVCNYGAYTDTLADAVDPLLSCYDQFPASIMAHW